MISTLSKSITCAQALAANTVEASPANSHADFIASLSLLFVRLLLLQPAEVTEFLHALALDFGAIDVALAVDADEMQVVEFAELMPDAAVGGEQLAVGAIDHVELAVGIVHHQQIGLRRVRPFDDRADRAGRALLEHRDFAHERSVLTEHLHPVVAAVAHQDET